MSEDKIKKNRLNKQSTVDTSVEVQQTDEVASKSETSTELKQVSVETVVSTPTPTHNEWKEVAQELANILNVVLPFIPPKHHNSRLAQTRPLDQCTTMYLAGQALTKYLNLYHRSTNS